MKAQSELLLLNDGRKLRTIRIRHICTLAVISLCYLSFMQAQWSTDPASNLIVGYGLLPELCSDGTGGCYITYEQNISYPRHLILERLNRYGDKPWGTGKQIRGQFPEQAGAKIVEDGANGIIIGFLDYLDNGTSILVRSCAQRLDSSGNYLWGTDGVRVSLSETNQSELSITTDGVGGCLLAWVDTLGSLRMNRITADGQRSWGDSGIYVWNSPERPPLIADHVGGCYIVYGIGRLQRFDSRGSAYWPSTGLFVPMGASQIQTDDSDNVYLFGSIFVGIENGTYVWTKNVQKVSKAGQLCWGKDGIAVDSEKSNQPSPNYSMVVNPEGLVHLAWGNNSNGTSILQAQNIFPGGVKQFIQSKSVGARPTLKIGIFATPSIGDTIIYTWMDSADGRWILLSQRKDTSWSNRWAAEEVPITLSDFSDYSVISDGSGGLIAIWFVQSNFGLYAQQISRNGRLGEIVNHVELPTELIPRSFDLHQNYPNPFNPSTTIRFSIGSSTAVEVKVFDLAGREVQTLLSSYLVPAIYSVTWDAARFSSGVYFVRLRAGDKFVASEKIILIR